jgi:ABC-type uncharacterized transport system YnjBCD ATPase subunit
MTPYLSLGGSAFDDGLTGGGDLPVSTSLDMEAYPSLLFLDEPFRKEDVLPRRLF